VAIFISMLWPTTGEHVAHYKVRCVSASLKTHTALPPTPALTLGFSATTCR
jgi:hypothetical protein